MFTNCKLTLVLVGLVTLLTGFAPALHACPVGGMKYDVHRVDAFSTDVFHVVFYGGEDAVVVVDGDGDTDLDLYVYDENGHLIGSDTDATDYCVVRFHPRWTGPFRIEVRNLGSVYNVYDITAR
jgi:hypothetical protein